MCRGPKISDPKKTVSVTMCLEQYETVAGLAEEARYSVPNYIRQALRWHASYLSRHPEEQKNWWRNLD